MKFGLRNSWYFISLILLSSIACSSDSDEGEDSNPVLPPSLTSSCGAFNFNRKIANGEECRVGSTDSPLVRLLISGLSGEGVCTGTVIDNNIILTAAHCLEGVILNITVETTAGNKAVENYAVPQTYRDVPSGNTTVAFDDVALIFTREAIGIQPMPLLITKSPAIGVSGFIGGYGETAPGSLDATPRAGRANVTSVTNDHVEVRFEGNQAHPCRGDSGGPLVVSEGILSTKAIVGVVSQSDPSVPEERICRPGDITLYTNLRSPSVLAFLGRFAPNAGAL